MWVVYAIYLLEIQKSLVIPKCVFTKKYAIKKEFASGSNKAFFNSLHRCRAVQQSS